MWKGLALHAWTLDTTPLAELLRIVQATGWDAIEFRRVDFTRARDAGQTIEQVIDLVRKSGIPVACVGAQTGWMFAEGDQRRRLLDAFAETCRWAADLQCSTVMSPVDPGRGEIQHAVASVREVGDIAAAYGVRLALEFNSQAEQFNRLECVSDLLKRSAHAHCGVLLDTYHFQRSGGDIRTLDAFAPGEIVYVHYSDVPGRGLQPGNTLDRLPPGRGNVPFREIFGWLSGAHYSGYLSYEAPNPSAWGQKPEAVAREARDATCTLLAAASSAP